MGGFYRQKEGGTKKLKEWIISGKNTFPWGIAGVPLRLITSLVFRKLQTEWFKIPLPGEAETAVRLLSFGLVMWLSKSDSILASFFFFFSLTGC